MPAKFEYKNTDLVITTAQTLKKATRQFEQVAADMKKNGMTEALFPWTQRQWECLDVVITLANQCVAVLPSQIDAKAKNRPSVYERRVKSGPAPKKKS